MSGYNNRSWGVLTNSIKLLYCTILQLAAHCDSVLQGQIYLLRKKYDMKAKLALAITVALGVILCVPSAFAQTNVSGLISTNTNLALTGSLDIDANGFNTGTYQLTAQADQVHDTLWVQNWESGWGSWWVDGGQWQGGVPTSGPGAAYSGSNCAGTVLDGNYVEPPYGGGSQTSRLISPSFVVPSDNPRLRFNHWYNFSWSDYGFVQIRANGGDWVTVFGNYIWNSNGWTRPSIDMSMYADSTVEIAFVITTENSASAYAGVSAPDVATGWYVDDIVIEYGPEILVSPENFESGDVNWWVDRGQWQVGDPTSGPVSAYSGSNCAGTVLNGNYAEPPYGGGSQTSRLISPSFVVPSDNPRLRFNHWYNFSWSDNGYIQIRVNGGEWVTLFGNYIWKSNGWTQPSIDLSTYADSTVEIAFAITTQNSSSAYAGVSAADVATGWYVDDFLIVHGEISFVSPEGFESNDGDADWWANYGQWQLGVPTSGPDSAYSGNNCAGTVLNGNYAEPPYGGGNQTSRLISPSFVVPSNNPKLRFYHWYDLSWSDYGYVQVRVNGGEWVTASSTFSSTSGGWTPAQIQLSDYVGLTVEVGFLITTQNDPSAYAGVSAPDVSTGWYIDEVSIEPPGEQPPQIVCPSSPLDVLASIPGEVCVPLNIINANTVTCWNGGIGPYGTWNNGSLCFPAHDTAGTYEIYVAAENSVGVDTCFALVTVSTPPIDDDIRLTDASGDSWHGNVAVDGSGNIHVAWQDTRDGNDEIYYSKLDNNGNTLVDDARLTNDNAQSVWPRIELDGLGNVHIVWIDERSSGPELYYTKLDIDGNTLIDDKRLTFNGSNNWSRELLVDDNNNLHILWASDGEGNFEIYYAKLDNNGDRLINDIRITNAVGEGKWPKLGVDDTGDIHLAWNDSRTGSGEIHYKKLDNSGITLVNDTRLTYDGSATGAPFLEADKSGNIHIIWADNRNGFDELFFTKLDNLGNTLIDDKQLTTVYWGRWMDIDNSDCLHVIWSDDRDGNDEIYYAKFDNNGNKIIADTRLTDNSAASWWPRICVDETYKYHVIWDDDRDGNREIYYTNGISLPEIECPETTLYETINATGIEVCVDLPIYGADTQDIFIDGANWADNTLCFIADSLGLYQFTVIVENANGADTCTVSINVNNQPTVLFYEDFEDGVLDSRISIQTVGSFNYAPDIKDLTSFGSTKAYGYGRSTCNASCFYNYVTRLIITFPAPTYAHALTFKEMELYGNWGAKGMILIDGELFTPGDQHFGRLPHNDHTSDTSYRVPVFLIDKEVTTVEIQVYDITNRSEIFVDDITIWAEEVFASIECPDTVLHNSINQIGTEVCVNLPIYNVDAQDVIVDGGYWVDSTLCFMADSIGIYQFMVIAENAFNADTCEVTVNVNMSDSERRLTDANGDSWHGNVKVDGSGNIHVVWEDTRDNNSEIYYSKLDNNGNTLVDDIRLTNDNAESVWPKIEFDGLGNAHVLWIDQRTGNSEVYYTKLDLDGNTLIGDKRLTFEGNSNWSRELKVDDNNDLHLLWTSDRDGNFEIYYAKLDNNGDRIINDIRLTNAAGEGKWPKLVIDSNGDLHIAWNDARTGNEGMFYKKLDNGGNTLINDTNISNAGSIYGAPHVDVDKSDNIHITWGDNRNSNNEIFYTKLDNIGNTLIDDKLITSWGNYGYLQDIDNSGNLHIAWSDVRDGNDEIYYCRLDNSGNKITADTRLTNNSAASWWPRICVDETYKYHVIWDDNRDGNREIYYTNGISMPEMVVAPTNLLFETTEDSVEPPTPQTINISSSDAPGALDWNAIIAKGADWLEISPATGTNPASVTVSIKQSALPMAAGIYNGLIKFSDDGVWNSPVYVNVTLFVESGVDVGDYVAEGGTTFQVPINLYTTDLLTDFTLPLKLKTIQPDKVKLDSIYFDPLYIDSIIYISDSEIAFQPIQPPPIPEDTAVTIGFAGISVGLDAAPEVFYFDTTTVTHNEIAYSYQFVKATGDTIVPEFDKGVYQIGETPRVSLTIEDLNCPQGSMIGVPVTALGIENVGGLQLSISYDQSVVRTDSVIVSSDYFTPTVNDTLGIIYLAWTNPANPFTVTDNEALLTLWFTGIGNAGAISSISWTGSNILGTPNGSPIPNIEYIDGSVQIIDNAGIISGRVSYYTLSSNIADVEIHVAGPGNDQVITNQDGWYMFEGMPDGNYTVSATHDADDAGVDILDAILIMNKLAGIIDLSPYESVAADVNQDCQVKIVDVVKILRKITMLENFPGNWSFMDRSFAIGNDNWCAAPNNISRTVAGNSLMDLHFVGVRKGDVNGDWNPQNEFYAKLKDNDNGQVNMAFRDAVFEEDGRFDISLTLSNGNSLAGLEIHLSYDSEQIEFIGVNSDILPGLVANAEDNNIHLAWIDIDKPLKKSDDVDAVKLTFRMRNNNDNPPSIKYDRVIAADERARQYSVFVSNLSLSSGVIPSRFSLAQNYPNPFNPITKIAFHLPVINEVRLDVFNVLGQRVRTLVDGLKEPGVHSVIWDGKDDAGALVASGIYFYSLKTESHIACRKMILLK
ncbi:MAG: choice-of-anchor J domain-containing protein [Candidatus Zixiibacteriota bacterium]